MDDGSSRSWEMTETEGRYRFHLIQGSTKGTLAASDACIQGVRGLSQRNRQILQQRGSVGEPLHQLREASRRMGKMASVVSKLKLASGEARAGDKAGSDPDDGHGMGR